MASLFAKLSQFVVCNTPRTTLIICFTHLQKLVKMSSIRMSPSTSGYVESVINPSHVIPETVNRSFSTFDDLSSYKPAINAITDYLQIKDLKSLSRVSWRWFDNTVDPIKRRSRLVLGNSLSYGSTKQKVHPLRRPYERVCVASKFKSLVPDAVRELALLTTHVEQDYVNQFKMLRKLTLSFCTSSPGVWDNITSLHIETTSDCRQVILPNLTNLKLSTTNSYEVQTLALLLNSHPGITTLDLTTTTDMNCCVPALENHPNIEWLRLTIFFESNSPASFAFIGRMQRLSYLDFNAPSIKDFISTMSIKNLFHFTCRTTIHATNDEFKHWLEYAPNLKYLQLSRLSISSLPIALIGKCFPNLEQLLLGMSASNQNDSVNFVVPMTTATTFSKLTKLTLVNFRNTLVVRHFAAPNLVELNLDSVRLKLSSINNMKVNFPKLQELRFNNTDQNPIWVPIQFLHGLPTLQTLSIRLDTFNHRLFEHFFRDFCESRDYKILPLKEFLRERRSAKKVFVIGPNQRRCYFYVEKNK